MCFWPHVQALYPAMQATQCPRWQMVAALTRYPGTLQRSPSPPRTGVHGTRAPSIRSGGQGKAALQIVWSHVRQVAWLPFWLPWDALLPPCLLFLLSCAASCHSVSIWGQTYNLARSVTYVWVCPLQYGYGQNPLDFDTILGSHGKSSVCNTQLTADVPLASLRRCNITCCTCARPRRLHSKNTCSKWQ